MKHLITILLAIIALNASAQYRTLPVDSSEKDLVKLEMMSKASQELQKFHNQRLTGRLMSIGGAGLATLGFYVSDPTIDAYSPLVPIGGLVAIVGTIVDISSSVHVKRAGLYIDASLSGIRITF